jgi:hypothetical protein
MQVSEKKAQNDVLFLCCLWVYFWFQGGRGSKVAIEGVRGGFQNQVTIGAFVKMVRNLSFHGGREFSF